MVWAGFVDGSDLPVRWKDPVPIPSNARWWLKKNGRGYAGSARSKHRPRARVSRGAAQIVGRDTQACSISVGSDYLVYRLRRQRRSIDPTGFVHGSKDSARSDLRVRQPSIDKRSPNRAPARSESGDACREDPRSTSGRCVAGSARSISLAISASPQTTTDPHAKYRLVPNAF